jgi:hypothetical protein
MLFNLGLPEKVKIKAIPDTGATLNVISDLFLTYPGPEGLFERTGKTSLDMANGRTISTLGRLIVSCSFLDAPKKTMEVLFHVCSDLAENVHVVVGRRFLEQTETLTRFTYRMTERTNAFHEIPRVMSLARESSHPWSLLAIRVGSRSFLAYPDTGSEIDLFSAAFAVEKEFVVQKLSSKEPTSIQYANGRHEEILGKTIVDISIAKDKSKPNTEERYSDSDLFDSPGKPKHDSSLTRSTQSGSSLSCRRTFYVVKNLACNIILGQAFLYSIDAYNTCKHAFVEVEPLDCRDTLKGIFKFRKHDNALPKAPSKLLYHSECHWKSLTCDTATASELASALDKVDQRFITDRRELEKKISAAVNASTERRLKAEKEKLRQKHHTDMQRIRKQYDDFKAQNPGRRR